MANNNACDMCSTSINFFTRKKCSECLRYYCSRCIVKSSSPLQQQKFCTVCTRLTSFQFTRLDLERYTVKELRQFLVRRNLRLDNCKEKGDLVDAMMRMSHVPSTMEDREHLRHVEEMKEKMMRENLNVRSANANAASVIVSDIPPSSATTPPVPHPPPTPIDASDVNIIPPPSSADSASALTGGDVSEAPRSGVVTATNDVADAPVAPSEDVTESSEISERETTPDTNTMTTTSSLIVPRMKLEQVSAADDIDTLSVRQLKELLVTNYVDYKGCCERQELIERVKRLWIDDQKNKGIASDDKTPSDSDLCKVCMDAIIDCILLECGHMITCTQCGKRMAECPACRHYVSRVVHVFKA